MFHYFHDDFFHKKSQGSISKDDFYKIINFVGRENIIDANLFFEKFKNKKLKNNEICITFDDAVKSQIDIALPVLQDLKINSFFFIPTSIFDKTPNNLELFRYFRTNYYENINKFYEEFYKFLDKDLSFFFKKNDKEIKSSKIKFPHYSLNDIKFRLVRDIFLNQYQYEKLMFQMIKDKKFNYKKIYPKLFFNKNDVKKLDNLGHLIGLHSHNQPPLLEKLSYTEQKYQYDKNINVLSEILSKPKKEIKYVSHPSGSYNEDTLKILNDLGVELGFKQIMTIEPEKGMKKINNSSLEIARQDHSLIHKMLS